MAITAVTNCLGPPPLPPGKKMLQRSSRKLSSTYKSFRDPAVEAWIPNETLESTTSKLRPRHDDRTVVYEFANNNLFRSYSEGNLRSHKMTTATILRSTSPLNKCIKAIYGSWKNLLLRKLTILNCITRLELDYN